MLKEDLLNEESYDALMKRVHTINKETKPLWGTMNAAQMMAHCTEIQKATNGEPLKVKSSFFLKLIMPLIKKMVLTGNYKRNTKTHPAFKQTNPKDFDTEKQRLIESLQVFQAIGLNHHENLPHEFFGKMTIEEKGISMYKHLNYHLEQFNA